MPRPITRTTAEDRTRFRRTLLDRRSPERFGLDPSTIFSLDPDTLRATTARELARRLGLDDPRRPVRRQRIDDLRASLDRPPPLRDMVFVGLRAGEAG